MSHISNFIDAMSADGFAPRNIADVVMSDGESVLISDANDKGAAMSLYYSLSEVDGKAFGRWYSCRESRGGSWYSRTGAKWSADDKQKWKELKDAKEAERLALRDRVASECHAKFIKLPYATEHPYLACKSVRTHKTRISGDTLVIPALNKSWQVRTLQYIYPDGTKLFTKDGEKSGNFFPIGLSKNDQPARIYVCEGFATGATIHEATGVPTVVAFDAGNLLPVCKAIRERFTQSEIVVCADNDESGRGLEAGTVAAANVNGSVIMPEQVGMDFNDMGTEYTKNRLASVGRVTLPIRKPREVEQTEVSDSADADSFTGDIYEVVEKQTIAGDFGLQFKILGYNDKYKLYYSFREKQLVALSPQEHNFLNLLRLARRVEWEKFVNPNGHNMSDTFIMKSVADNLFEKSTERGIYDINGKVRGSGCWLENNKVVLHTGNNLIVDGKKYELYEARGKNVYVVSAAAMTPATVALSNHEANELRELCNLCLWENQLSGDLLAGWIVAAQVCSLLKWRPHIWVSGAAGSGKSTVLNDLIKPALGDVAMIFMGGTTEAGIRQQMNYDARPIIYDECEPDDPAMDGVLQLAKLASSGGQIAKFGQAKIDVRWSFVFASVDRKVKDLAVESRISLLRLKKPIGVDRTSSYDDFLQRVNKTVKSENFSGRLLKRTMDNIDVFMDNVNTFSRALNKHLKDARSADQVAPMLAGVYLLCKTTRISQADALAWVEARKWDTHTTYDATPDHVRLVDHIMASIIRVNNHGDRSVGDMVMEVLNNKDEFYRGLLRNYGIVVNGEYIYFAARHKNLKAMLRQTQWYDSWANTLMDYNGAIKANTMRFSGGVRSNATGVPISEIIAE